VRRALSVVAAIAVLASSCGGASPGSDPAAIRIVIVQPGGVPDGLELVSSTPLGVEVAIEEAVARGDLPAGSDIGVLELTDDAEADRARAAALADDPSVIVAFLAPFTDAPGVVEILIGRGVPVVSLSGVGTTPDQDGWLRLVPSTRTEATALMEVVRLPACVTGATEVSWALAESLASAPDAPRVLAADPHDAAAGAFDCADVIWLGDAEGAMEVRETLDTSDRGDVGLVVSLAARAERLAREGFPTMVGTRAIGPCVSLLTSAEAEAQRFVHAFQAAHGIAPGPCAAEAYAAASRIAEALDETPTRVSARAAVAGMRRLRIPGGLIVFGADGGPVTPGPARERIVGVRWLPEAGT
jgi:hypothetical protein